MDELIKKLEYAKSAVLSTLANANTLVDWYGLAYWAQVVENLRKEIKEKL